jgi:hypothetical protein
MLFFQFHIQLVVKETGMGLAGLLVSVYDKNLSSGSSLGASITNRDGSTNVFCNDSKGLLKGRPALYFKISSPVTEKSIFESDDSFDFDTKAEVFIIPIPLDKLFGIHANSSVQLFGSNFMNSAEPLVAVGDTLMISAQGLAPAYAHDIELFNEEDRLFTSRLMTDQFGNIPNSALWPQFGMDDAHSDTIYTVDEANEIWHEKKLTVRIVCNNMLIATNSITVGLPRKPMMINVDNDGRMLNGFEYGAGAVTVAGYHFDPNSDIRVYLVKQQADWLPGDKFSPVDLLNAESAFIDAEPDEIGHFKVMLAETKNIGPGAYDFIARNKRYGYEDEDDFILRESDVVTRHTTGVVIRQNYMESKVVHNGCVNMLPLSGHPLNESPHFILSEAFPPGSDIYIKADPPALQLVRLGKMAAIYVIKSKTPAKWNASTSLNHLAVLGGNNNVIIFKNQVASASFHRYLVWPTASVMGNYDVVLDFGNNASDAAQFVPDNNYDIAVPPATGDIIDGYMVPGFRIVKDPGVNTNPSISYVGQFDYTEGTYNAFPLTARVMFPADIAGAVLPSQISSAKSSYPMTFIVHGSGHTYKGYDYLLHHWAGNGFIAISIHLSFQQPTVRAELLFEHIKILKIKFGSKAENNIGIMGHSRGGEAVAIAPRLNYERGLGHNLNAVISLAPTNDTGAKIISPWAVPYYVMYGSLDQDIDGFGLPYALTYCGFPLYDNAAGAKKAMLFIYGATHNRFVAPPGVPSVGAPGWEDIPKWISEEAHHAIAKAYMTAFFRQHLLNDAQFDGVFTGEWVPRSVALADPGKTQLFCQYRDTPSNRRTIDDFEEPHTDTSWQHSTIGGTVSHFGLLGDPKENMLYNLDQHSPHTTSGLGVRWHYPGARLDFSIPFGENDLSSFQTLSFRVTQRYDPIGNSNPLNADQDFYLLLHDATGNERMVKASKFGRIPYPFVRKIHSRIMSALCTIRIPLHAFTIECAGAPKVDLTRVDKLSFVFGCTPHGSIQLDDIEFVV